MKGIILAGGRGTRLYPMTKCISKQLLPIYDKPLVYYPLSVLLLCGIRDILIITSPNDLETYKELLGSGNQIGVNISYVVQTAPRGIAEAFVLGKEFIGNDSVTLILGDNLFYGQGLSFVLESAKSTCKGATIFGYQVGEPRNFGVVEISEMGDVISLEEKPALPKSKYAVPGLYFYDNDVVEIAKSVNVSKRNELEITSVNNIYLRMKRLNCIVMGRGMAWLDTGTPQGMLQASQFVETVQMRQGLYIACIEEIAWRQGFINGIQLEALGRELEMTDYGKYILTLI